MSHVWYVLLLDCIYENVYVRSIDIDLCSFEGFASMLELLSKFDLRQKGTEINSEKPRGHVNENLKENSTCELLAASSGACVVDYVLVCVCLCSIKDCFGPRSSSKVGKLAHISFSHYMGDMDMQDYKLCGVTD
ncbi:unnamed protein product, partial [Pieris brassicae]